MRNLITLLVLAFTISCDTATNIAADDFAIRWEMGANSYQGKTQFLSAFVLRNDGKETLPSSGWTIYFNLPRYIRPETVTGDVTITHINGDFYALAPLSAFSLKPSDSVRIQFVSSDWAINESDAPAGLYLVTGSGDTEGTPAPLEKYTVAPFADDNQSRRTPGDDAPVVNAAILYEKHAATQKQSTMTAAVPLVPAPASYLERGGMFELDQTTVVRASESLSREKQFLEGIITEIVGQPVAGGGKTITLRLGAVAYQGKRVADPDAYQLEITPGDITITGAAASGVFYGIQTLRALMPVAKKTGTVALKAVAVVDFPRFGYRGIHLDVARNFQRKATVLKMLDLMSFYKLNKLHFHLSDDEGWRVEMKSIPELTAVGGQRSHDKSGKGMVPSFGSGPFANGKNSYGSGFYTEDDFVEILRYASARHIEVIPKIDMPGHARAAIKAMDARYERLKAEGNDEDAMKFLLRDPQDTSRYRSVQQWNDNVLCVCNESTYNFIKAIVGGFKNLYARAESPFTTFHIGADEVPHGVWEGSPACARLIAEKNLTVDDLQQYFYRRVSEVLREQGLNMGGWEEIALKKVRNGNSISLEANPEFVNSNFKPYVWNSVWGWDQEDAGYKLANAGYKIVLGNVTNLYFDLAYEKHPQEPGYYWGAFVDTRSVYDFNPFDIYAGAKNDKFGKPLDSGKLLQKTRLADHARNNILGLQGQLWAENIKGQASLEYMAFPKLLALADRAWSVQSPAWAHFAKKLGETELPRLDLWNVGYRISPPGAIIKNGMLLANVEYPGLTIRYTTDGTEPSIDSPTYTQPVPVNGRVKLRAFNTTNRSSRTIIAKPE